MKNRKQNRLWTPAECIEALYPKSARIRMLRLAMLSGLVRKNDMNNSERRDYE